MKVEDFRSLLNQIDSINEEDSREYFAVFLIAKVGDSYAATTRDDGRIGLPGGKVDPGETAEEAVIRESREEGWEIDNATDLQLAHEQPVEGKPVAWFSTNQTPVKLTDYKEKKRGIRPILISKEEVLNSGFGNENLTLD